MQYSLRTMMLLIVLAAVWFAAPSISNRIGVVAWYLAAGILVTRVWPSGDSSQVFARGSLAAYAAMTIDRHEFDSLAAMILHLCIVILAGWLSVVVARHVGQPRRG